MRRPTRDDLEDIRRSQRSALYLLGCCIRRRPIPDMLWRSFVVLTCEELFPEALVA
jgi:hypothetical protein